LKTGEGLTHDTKWIILDTLFPPYLLANIEKTKSKPGETTAKI